MFVKANNTNQKVKAFHSAFDIPATTANTITDRLFILESIARLKGVLNLFENIPVTAIKPDKAHAEYPAIIITVDSVDDKNASIENIAIPSINNNFAILFLQ